MLVVALTLVLCACANGMALNPRPSHVVYKTFPGLGRYFFDPAPANWTDASKICRLYNGQLAYPKSLDEANAIWGVMDEFNVSQIHAGFHDQFFEGTYVTSRGKPINETDFQQWSSGSPIGGKSNNCGGLRRDGLTDVACQSKHPSICEDKEEGGGSEGFKDYVYIAGHGHFKYYNLKERWPEALKTCFQDGAHLWILNSADEYTAVANTFNILPTVDVWVGAHHLFADRYFVTIFDEPLESTGYNTWAPDEPAGSWSDYPFVVVRETGLRILGVSQVYVCEYNPEDARRA